MVHWGKYNAYNCFIADFVPQQGAPFLYGHMTIGHTHCIPGIRLELAYNRGQCRKSLQNDLCNDICCISPHCKLVIVQCFKYEYGIILKIESLAGQHSKIYHDKNGQKNVSEDRCCTWLCVAGCAPLQITVPLWHQSFCFPCILIFPQVKLSVDFITQLAKFLQFFQIRC